MDTITEYFNDLLEAHNTNILPPKLKQSELFKFTTNSIDYTRYVVLKHSQHFENIIAISLYEQASSWDYIGETFEIPMYIVMNRNEIFYCLKQYSGAEFSDDLVLIESESDLFALRTQYDFSITYDNLKLLQMHVHKIKGLVQIFYSTGEEKYYGYE